MNKKQVITNHDGVPDNRRVGVYTKPPSNVKEYELSRLNGNTSVYGDVYRERVRQDEKWGPSSHSPVEWMSLLSEEVGEAATMANILHWPPKYKSIEFKNIELKETVKFLREELVQVAAVAVAIIEDLDKTYDTSL